MPPRTDRKLLEIGEREAAGAGDIVGEGCGKRKTRVGARGHRGIESAQGVAVDRLGRIIARDSQRAKVGEATEQITKTGTVKFYKVDKQPFIDQVQSVYKKNADKVGGIELIELIDKWY